MLSDKTIHLPRLYVSAVLSTGESISLDQNQAHYLRNVLRRSEGDEIRLFNGHDGEWRAELTELAKKRASVECKERLREQIGLKRPVHLYFAPIAKKERLSFLIEKSVELGVTALHPVITERTEARKIHMGRLRSQIIEAAEQCERLDLPIISDARALPAILAEWSPQISLFAALERMSGEAPDLKEIHDKISAGQEIAVLIGPEGGFSAAETVLIEATKGVQVVSLGPIILRAETAALKALSFLG